MCAEGECKAAVVRAALTFYAATGFPIGGAGWKCKGRDSAAKCFCLSVRVNGLKEDGKAHNLSRNIRDRVRGAG